MWRRPLVPAAEGLLNFTMMLSNNNKRPKFLHLLKIAMPVTAVASFAHRVSGLLMVLATPALIYTLEVSLRDAAGYAQVQHWLAQPLFRLLLIVLCCTGSMI